MKNFKFFTIVFVLASLFPCKIANSSINNPPNLKILLDRYFNYYGEYPTSAENLFTFCDEKMPLYDENFPTDSVGEAVKFVMENRNDIHLEYANPTVMTEKLLITMGEDTIVNIQQKKHLSFLWNILESFDYYCYDNPSSLDELIVFFEAIKGTENDALFDRCVTSTLRYLDKNRDRISWQSNDTLLLITSDNDTIDFRYGNYNPPCSRFDWRKRYEFRYFDKKCVYIPDNEIDAEFRQGLKMLKEERNFVMSDNDRSKDPALVFTINQGLQLYCENITADLDSEWFKVLSEFCRNFAESHGIGKIIFASPCYQSEE